MEYQIEDSFIRDETVDILKGVAIFCVVLGHINPVNFVVDFIYSFHMALFMFLSGITFWFSFERKRISGEMNAKTICTYIVKRFLALIIPFLVWCEIKGNVLEHEKNILINIQNNFDSYWFLPTLFGIILFVSFQKLFIRFCNIKPDFIFDILVIFISGALSFFLYKITDIKIFRQVLIYLMPFFWGVFIKKYEIFKKFCSCHFLIGFSIITYFMILPFYSVASTSRLSLISRFFTGFLFTIIIFNYVEQNKYRININIKKYFSSTGKSSLSIYLIQEFFRNTVPIQLYGGGYGRIQY